MSLGNGLGRRLAIGVGLARIAHVLLGTNAQSIESVDRLVKHGLVVRFTGGLFGRPNQKLFREPLFRRGEGTWARPWSPAATTDIRLTRMIPNGFQRMLGSL